MSVVGLGALEISYIVLVGTTTALAGLFAIYVVVQHFRNPPRP